MSRGRDLIGVDGMRNLRLAMQKSTEEIQRTAMDGYKRVGQQIIVQAQRNLRDNGSVVTNNLRRSGKVQQVTDTDLDVGFFSAGDGYAFFVEHGRRAGKMPPVDMLEQWLRKKTSVRRGMKSAFSSAVVFMNRNADKYRRSIAFAIARKIAKSGSEAHPFFAPAVQKYKGQVTKVLSQAIKRVTG